jgi:ferredoxin
MRRLLTRRGWPLLPQVAVALALVATVVLLAFGHENPELNPGMYLIWSLWWPVLPLSFIAFGRIWCAVCPVSLLGDRAERARLGGSEFPRLVVRHGTAALVMSFVAIHLANLWFRFEEGRRETGLLLGVLGSAAVALTLAFRGRAWCRAFCPVGALGRLLARLSPLRIENGTAACARECADRGCVGFESGQGLCPVQVNLRSGIDPGACILCGACLKACPRLGEVRWRGNGSAGAAPASGDSLAILALLGLALDMALTHLVDWPILYWRLATALRLGTGPWTEIAFHAAVVAVVPVLALALSALRRPGSSPGARLASLAGPALALAGAALLTLTLRPLLVVGPQNLRDLLRLAGWGDAALLRVFWRLDGLPLRLMQTAGVSAGIILAATTAASRFRQERQQAAGGTSEHIAAGALVVFAGAALLWILSHQLSS